MKSFNDFVQQLDEGVNDPSIFKAVFLAGGPGSGKSFIAAQTGFKALGFTIINSDDAFEHMMRKSGLDFKMPDSEQDQRDAVRAVAKATIGKKEDLAVEGRLGLVIDGTGKDYSKIVKMRANLALKGYDSAMVFVNTDLETALARNAKRERSVPEEMATKLWKEVQSNLGKFQQAFGNHFFIIDNSEGQDFKSQTTTVFKKLVKWSKEAPKNGVAVKWIEKQRMRKESVELEESTCDLVSAQQLKDLEKFGDRLLQKFDIDVEFTKHFGDRMSDSRNDPCIKISELQSLFKKIAKDKGNKVKQHKDHEAVLKDIQSDLNLPFVAKPKKDGEIELVMKTIMRKKNFKSPDPEVRYEHVSEASSPAQQAAIAISMKKDGKEPKNEDCGAGEEGTEKLVKKYKKDTPMEDTGSVKHHQFQKTFKHAKQHAMTHIDKDVDSDIDALDDTTPDEVTGTPDQTKLMMKKLDKEKLHIKKGVAFEDVQEGENKQMKGKDPCWKDYEMVGTKKKGDKTVPNCVPVKETVAIPLYVQEAAYDGNIGMMEVAKFYMKATPQEKEQFQAALKKKDYKTAWKMIQDKTGVKLKGKEFATESSIIKNLKRFAQGKTARQRSSQEFDKAGDAFNAKDSAATNKHLKRSMKFDKLVQKEEVAANSVAGGGVDMNPTGKPKWDKRSKFHVDHMFRRADGTKYKKKDQK